MNNSLEKYLKKIDEKKLYNLGKKYNNSLSAINKRWRLTRNRINIAWLCRNKKGEIIGAIVETNKKEWKALEKDLFFCFPAPLNHPFEEKDLNNSIMEDIVNICDPTFGIDMEVDLDIAKLKLKLKLSQIGWEIEDVTG